jgi:hypothetical protein
MITYLENPNNSETDYLNLNKLFVYKEFIMVNTKLEICPVFVFLQQQKT